MPVFPSNSDTAYKKHFAENIKPHLPLPMVGNEYVKVYTRCRYWPRCSNRKCKFVHPVYDCKLDKECPYDNLCAFRHSSDPVPENLTGYFRGRRKNKSTAPNANSKVMTVNEKDNNSLSEHDSSPVAVGGPTREASPAKDDSTPEQPSVAFMPVSEEPSAKLESINARFKLGAPVSMARSPEFESACLAMLVRDFDGHKPSQSNERNIHASPFPNTVFLKQFFGNERFEKSNSLNFEDCGTLMSWSRLEEHMTLGPNLTVASMKKIWQDIPNSCTSRHGLAR